jgi:hypothetical protein
MGQRRPPVPCNGPVRLATVSGPCWGATSWFESVEREHGPKGRPSKDAHLATAPVSRRSNNPRSRAAESFPHVARNAMVRGEYQRQRDHES